jgi:hypothetical protein
MWSAKFSIVAASFVALAKWGEKYDTSSVAFLHGELCCICFRFYALVVLHVDSYKQWLLQLVYNSEVYSTDTWSLIEQVSPDDLEKEVKEILEKPVWISTFLSLIVTWRLWGCW